MSATTRDGDPGADNRGAPASVAPDGSVRGSGAGAGGGGAPEDIDSDSTAGGGADEEPKASPSPAIGADAPKHGSR
ncbi:hypothetical protein [Sphingomonas sp. MMS24-J13]|uniref:hypothetical protein n=1 Tax=Sphingomonas sp. MMS24-J13 TaxID=3238686 RepID=UPI00384C3F01